MNAVILRGMHLHTFQNCLNSHANFKCIYFYYDPNSHRKRMQLDFAGKITLGVFDHQICASYDSG